MSIVWSDQALRDLRAIHDFIARDSDHYAKRQVERLISRVEMASRMPTRGHPVHEFPDGNLREVHEGFYRIIYAFESEELQVVTVVHMKQRVPKRRLR